MCADFLRPSRKFFVVEGNQRIRTGGAREVQCIGKIKSALRMFASRKYALPVLDSDVRQSDEMRDDGAEISD